MPTVVAVPATLQAQAARYLTTAHLHARGGADVQTLAEAAVGLQRALAETGRVCSTDILPSMARAVLSGFLGRPVTGEAR